MLLLTDKTKAAQVLIMTEKALTTPHSQPRKLYVEHGKKKRTGISIMLLVWNRSQQLHRQEPCVRHHETHRADMMNSCIFNV